MPPMTRTRSTRTTSGETSPRSGLPPARRDRTASPWRGLVV
jgi:hypothetical protein